VIDARGRSVAPRSVDSRPQSRASSLSPVRELRTIPRLPHSEDAGWVVERVRDAVFMRRGKRRCFLLLALRAVGRVTVVDCGLKSRDAGCFWIPSGCGRWLAGRWQPASGAVVDRALRPGAAKCGHQGERLRDRSTLRRRTPYFLTGQQNPGTCSFQGVCGAQNEKGTSGHSFFEFQLRQPEEKQTQSILAPEWSSRVFTFLLRNLPRIPN